MFWPKEKNFCIELLTGFVTVVYEAEHNGSGEIEAMFCEHGQELKISDLSEQERTEVEEALIYNLMCDREDSGFTDKELSEMARVHLEEWKNE
jgi:hypothetical protein